MRSLIAKLPLTTNWLQGGPKSKTWKQHWADSEISLEIRQYLMKFRRTKSVPFYWTTLYIGAGCSHVLWLLNINKDWSNMQKSRNCYDSYGLRTRSPCGSTCAVPHTTTDGHTLLNLHSYTCHTRWVQHHRPILSERKTSLSCVLSIGRRHQKYFIACSIC